MRLFIVTAMLSIIDQSRVSTDRRATCVTFKPRGFDRSEFDRVCVRAIGLMYGPEHEKALR